jgi:formylglycine-generating enzyme required for sulfatase activity
LHPPALLIFIHHSSFIIHHSSFIIHHSSFIIHHSSLNTALPLDELLLQLENEGFALDTGRRVRLLRALEKQGHRFLDPAEFQNLKYLIGPLVARSPREQERFYEIFEAFRAACVQEWEDWEKRPDVPPPGPTVSPKITPPPPAVSLWKRYWWAAVLLVFALALPYLIKDSTPEPVVRVLPRLREPGEDTLRLRNYSSGIDSALFRWRVLDAETGAVHFTDSAYHLTWPIPDATHAGREKIVELCARHPKAGLLADSVRLLVYCQNPPAAGQIVPPDGPLLTSKPYPFELPGIEPGCSVLWVSSTDDTLRGPRVQLVFETTGTHTVTAFVQRPGQETYCYAARSATITVGTDKPYLALLPLHEDTPRPQYRLHGWVWLLSLLPLLPAAWFFRRWRRKRHEKIAVKTTAELEQDYPVLDDKPYHIPYRPQEHKITVPRAFFRIAEVLHRREESLRRSFDVPESVRATIEGAGFPVLRERAGAQPAAYLFLVERRDARDQQGRLFTRLSEFLLRRETPAVFFEHDGAFDRYRNAEHPDGLDLAELRRRYPGHRLVLLGSAHHLVHTPAGKPPALRARLAVELARWPRRLLLTPEPPAAWAYQEKILHTAFLLFPADTDGMLDGFELLDRTEEHDPGPFDRWLATRRERRADHNHRFNAWQTPRDHRLYLLDDPDTYRWLCALAVCVQPDWALTLAIGRAIGVEVTHDRLLALTRIPWLSANQPDDTLRLAFLRDLDPADERAAREAVAEELEAVREQTETGFANIERRANLAVQYFALDPRDEAHRQTLRELRALGLLSGSHMAELDLVVQQKIRADELPPDTPRTIGGLLSVPAPRPLFTRDMVLALALLGLALLLGSCAWWLQTSTTPPLGSAPLYRAVAVPDPAVELNNRAVQLYRNVLEQTDYISWGNLNDSVLLADSLFEQAVLARRPEAYPLADSNELALRYNQAARGFNFFLDGAASGFLIGPENSTEQTQNNSNFSPERAIPTPSLLLGLALTFASIASDTVTLLSAPEARRLNALHASGLCAYYQEDAATARILYNRLLRAQPQYFDTLRVSMPVNLQTLLAVGAARPVADFEMSTDSCCAPCMVQFTNLSKGAAYSLWDFGDGNKMDMPARAAPNHLFTKAGNYTVTLISRSEYSADTLAQTLQICANPEAQDPRADNRERAAWDTARKADTQLGYERFMVAFPNAANYEAAQTRLKTLTNAEYGKGSFYADKFQGRKTAGGELYDKNALTAAHRTLPFGTNIRVTRIANGKSVVVRVNDRGPFRKGGVVDLSRKAAEAIGLQAAGVALVKVEVVEREQNVASDNQEKDWAAAQKTSTPAAYEAFLKQYPDGSYAAEARRLLNERRDEEAWMRARAAGTPEACRQYLTDYPQGKHAADAQECATPQATAPLVAPGPRPGQDMVLVRGGTYTMGCRDKKRDGDCEDDEKPAHDVTVRDFYIDRTEVTNTQYAAFLNAYGSDKVRDGAYKGQTMIEEHEWGVQKNAKTGQWEPAPGKDKHPVVKVSWYGSAEYARFYGMRLPTEAEWEYAARGGQKGQKPEYLYAGSDNPDEVAWYDGNSGNTTHPVRQKKANQLGLYDMSGNVWEWCSDRVGTYPSGAVTNPTGPEKGSYRVLRGGSWGNTPANVRAANRGNYDPWNRVSSYGFRLARAAGGG